MPATTLQSAAFRAVLVALLACAAACGDQEPMSPDPADPGSVETAVGAGTPELLTAGTGARILFSSTRTGGVDLYRMAPDGTGVVRVTSFTGPDQEAAWSWSNGRIAMVRDRADATNGPHKDIYLMNADGTGKKWARPTATPWNITAPSWSKDGTRLVATVWLGGDRGNIGVPYLAMMTVADGNMSFISDGLGARVGYTPSLDPTGKKIVYSGEGGKSLEMVNTDGTGHKIVIAAVARDGLPAGNLSDPVVSPDGKRVAFAQSYAGNWDIYVVTIADGTIKRLTTNATGDTQPTWSADGSRIAFTSNRSGQSQIWVMSSNGGSQTRITHTSASEDSPAWSH